MLGDLAVRFASAVALGVPFLIAVHAGPPYFDLIIVAAAGLLAWEWSRFTAPAGPAAAAGAWWRAAIFIGWTLLAVVFASAVAPGAGLLMAAAAALASLIWARRWRWLAAGLVYVALPCIALLWLRDQGEDGRAIVFWLLAVVWASDIGAYFSGRILGGPKLAPRISPNKTWAGFFGGAAAAAAIGAVAAPLLDAARPALLVAVSVLLGISAQAGDLFESWLKRRFGVKDTSALIPGHGGVLDRVDGLMAAALLLALIGLTGKGSMLAWL